MDVVVEFAKWVIHYTGRITFILVRIIIILFIGYHAINELAFCYVLNFLLEY